MANLYETPDTAKKDPGLLVRMADAAYRRPVDQTEEENRKKFEAKVIHLPWAELRIACSNYHGHKNKRA